MDKQLTMEQINKIAEEQKCKCGKDATRLIKPHSCIFWYFCEDCWNKIPVAESDDEDSDEEDSDEEEIITSK